MPTTPFGKMSIEPIFGIDTIKGIGARSSIWQILEAFVTQTEGLASRVSFGPTGAIILTTIPGDPNSGAFYLYDGNTSTFFSLTFDNQESFNASWFDLVVCAYDLHMFVDIPVAVDEKPLLPHNRRRHHRGQHANNRPNEIHVQRTLAA